MSIESNRIGFRTGANANLLSILGDLVSSDGIQALRVPLGTPGQVLTVDLTAECGMSWQPGGGGAGLTFSDGLTLAATNVTNDLVTGAAVASIDGEANGNAVITAANTGAGAAIVQNAFTGAQLILDDNGHTALFIGSQHFDISTAGNISIAGNQPITIDSALLLDLAGSGVRIRSDPASQLILGAGSTWHAAAANNFDFVNDVGGNGSFVVTTDGTGGVIMNVSRDETHTIARNLSLSAAGAAGATIEATTADVKLRAGTVSGTGVVSIQAGTNSSTRQFSIFDGAGAGQQTVAAPTGGSVIDSESRTAIDAIIATMQAWGFYDI